MATAVTAYDHLVNGHGPRVIDLALGRVEQPNIEVSTLRAPESLPRVLALKRYTAQPSLRVDSDALEPILQVLVHGSVATEDTCAFSDVDIAVIVDDRRSFTAEQHAKAIAALRTLLGSAFSYDRLMHHGLMFFPASGLLAYDQSFLPIETLRLSRVLHGPLELTFWESPTKKERFTASLLSSARSLRKHFNRRDSFSNDFLLKQVTSGVLLMPSRVLAARDIQVYKRDSFAMARDYFTARSWELIEQAEAVRSAWTRPKSSMIERVIPQNAHPYLRNVASQRFAPVSNARRLSERTISAMERSADAFLDRVESMA